MKKICASHLKEASSALVEVPTQKSLRVLIDEIELRCKRSLADPYDPEACENSMRDIPALVEALRHACENIGYFSDLYCGLNDMTGRNALAQIAAILTK